MIDTNEMRKQAQAAWETMIDLATTGGKSFKMTIPVDEERDTDRILGRALQTAHKAADELDALRARVAELEASIPQRMEPCEMCLGSGQLWTECCNGSGGCDCHGQQVFMGPCLECGGRGEIPEGSAVPYAQSATKAYMQSVCPTGYVGSGPYGRTR